MKRSGEAAPRLAYGALVVELALGVQLGVHALGQAGVAGRVTGNAQSGGKSSAATKRWRCMERVSPCKAVDGFAGGA